MNFSKKKRQGLKELKDTKSNLKIQIKRYLKMKLYRKLKLNYRVSHIILDRQSV